MFLKEVRTNLIATILMRWSWFNLSWGQPLCPSQYFSPRIFINMSRLIYLSQFDGIFERKRSWKYWVTRLGLHVGLWETNYILCSPADTGCGLSPNFKLGCLRREWGPRGPDRGHLKFAYEYVCLILNTVSPDEVIRQGRGSRKCYELIGVWPRLSSCLVDVCT